MSRKSYNEGCLGAHALDLIGDRWAILVLRELMLGPKRFGVVRAGLPGIATNILTQRLEGLEAAGLLIHRIAPPPVSAPVYELTEAGRGTRAVMNALCRWGVAQPGHDPRLFISPSALMISMGALVRPAIDHRTYTVGFALGDELFQAQMGDGGFDPAPVPHLQADLEFRGAANAVAPVIYGPLPLVQATGAFGVAFHGDPGLGQAFVDRFSLRAP